MKQSFVGLISIILILLTGCKQTSDFQPFVNNLDINTVSSYQKKQKSDWFENLKPELQTYYAEAQGKTGAELFDSLHTIISRNYKIQSYNAAKSIMYSDIDNTALDTTPGIIDVYSQYFVPGEISDGYKEPGDGNKDGYPADYVNCEHSWPQSYYGKSLPMVSDLHHLQPTLSIPNTFRSTFPFGEASKNIVYTNSGGSKLSIFVRNGNLFSIKALKEKVLAARKLDELDLSKDYIGVFEPAEQQKGNTARAMLYFYLRYYNMNIRQGWYEKDFFWTSRVKTFIKWSEQTDPINDKDIRRNNLIFQVQNNRNPFIDIPNLASLIGEDVFKSKKINRK